MTEQVDEKESSFKLNVDCHKDENGARDLIVETTNTLPTDMVTQKSNCKICHCDCCRSFLIKYNPLPVHSTRWQRVRYAFLCPAHGHVATVLTVILSACLLYGTLWGITGSSALPGGNLFALLLLTICSSVAGILVEKIRLPSLLGMLLAGFALKNIPAVNVAKDIETDWSSALRNVALTVILTRAGLGLDPVALRKLSFGVLRLAFTPCLVETVTAAVASHFLLGFPWIWGFMLGFVLAAVSPAVVVPSLLSLQARGYGTDKGISTLVIAASSLDDIISITGFGVVLGIAFSTGSLAWTIVKGPLEAVIGILYGTLFGIALWYIPHKKHPRKTIYQFVLLLAGGLFSTFGSRRAHIEGAGPLGVLTLAFVVNLGWRKQLGPSGENEGCTYFGHLWTVFQPILFGLIGAEVSLEELQPATIGLGLAVLAIGLALRIIASFFVVFGLGLSLREKLFIPFAWLPKATVQAAIGSIALDTARAKGFDPKSEPILLGIQLLTIAVLAIIVTAPVGAIAISLSGPVLLNKSLPSAQVTAPIDVVDETSLTNEAADGIDQLDVGDGVVPSSHQQC